MANENKRIVGVYNNEEEAIQAVQELQAQGYDKESISVIGKNREDIEAITDETGSKADEGLAAGAATGGALGGLAGLLAGVGALAIPGIGPIVAAGPIAATLTGAALGAGAGGLAGALIGMGIPEEEANRYDAYVKEGKILVLVDENPAVTETMAGAPTSADTGFLESRNRDVLPDRNDEESLQLREEKLNVYKNEVQTGEVELHKEVREEQKTVNVPVTKEEVYVERRPVEDADGLGVSNGPIGEEEEIHVPVVEEKVTVTKEPVVTEEVVVGKRKVQETEQVVDNVKREDVRVERKGDTEVEQDHRLPR